MPRLVAIEHISLGVGAEVLRIAPGEAFDCPAEGVAQLLALGAAEPGPEIPAPAADPPTKPRKQKPDAEG